MKEPNIPKPTSSVATLVISTVGWRSISMSTSGCGVRRWSMTQRLRITAPAANSPSVRGSPQPHSFAWAIARSGALRPKASTIAPRMSTRPGVRTGDSGTKISIAIAATAALIAPSQKIQW